MKSTAGKSVFYRDDGTGRDSYIAVNSGGYFPFHQTMPEFPVSTMRRFRTVKPVTPNSPHKLLRYISDGTGRDGYIVGDYGGFLQGGGSARKTRFEGNLRQYGFSRTAFDWYPAKQRATRL